MYNMNIKRFTYGICHANSYIVSDENTGNAIMIDSCGCNDKVIKYLDDNNFVLKGILLSHGHFDHIAGLKELKRYTGADVYIYIDEEKFLNDAGFNLSDDAVFSDDALDKADYLFCDGDVLDIGGLKVEVLHTPGHTSGSVCFQLDDCIFTGDTLFKGSVGRFDFPTGDGFSEIKSIKEKLLVLNDDIKVYPGHGFSTTIGREREENPYLCG